MLSGAEVPVVIVGFRNAGDICDCLAALTRAKSAPTFAVVICENGGAAAFDALVAALSAADAPCAGEPEIVGWTTDALVRLRRLRLGQGGPIVLLAEARENLGYAGGINAWIRPLLEDPTWSGLWVLNPDTKPEPEALFELVDYANRQDRGMVGSRLMYVDNPDIVRSRGLTWRKLVASPLGVDIFAPVLPPPDPDDVDRRIDAPSGASFYVTRTCLERIGLMDECYFLYFEDLDWGLRAKASCGIGYAYRSVVPHIGGSTVGSASSRAARSELSVYLDFRNRVMFVRNHHSAWFAWTVAMGFVRSFEFLAVGAIANFKAALRGTLAGFRGETGRPDHMMPQLVDRRIEP